MNRYPYPVLAMDNSSYDEEICFELSYLDSKIVKNQMILEIDVRMNSSYLRQLIDKKIARLVVKVQTGIYSGSLHIANYNGKNECTMPLEYIENNDVIRMTSYVVLSQDYTLNYSMEFISIYDEGYSVNLKKNNVLAISNTERLSYNTTSNDFIKFSVVEDREDKGYAIDYGSNFINVQISKEFNKAYGLIKNNKKDVCSVFDSHLVFEVFVYIIIDLVQQYDEYRDSQWYKLFEQMFLQVSGLDSFEEYIRSARDGELIQLPVVYELANRMTNNQVELSLITVSKLEEE